MFHTITVPVDIAPTATSRKATAAMRGRTSGGGVTFVGVGASIPSPRVQAPATVARRLADVAASHAVTRHDPAPDLNDTVLRAADDIGADCIVMDSHVPTFAERLWPSHGGSVPHRATASAFDCR